MLEWGLGVQTKHRLCELGYPFSMEIKQLINHRFNSNTYLLKSIASQEVWLIDLGAFSDDHALQNDNTIKGAFLTHCHYDHIFEIDLFSQYYPAALIYASHHTVLGLKDPKLNLSFYHDYPIEYEGDQLKIVDMNDQFELSNEYRIRILETPGHNPGCLSYQIDNYIFTGDSYIPYTNVVTKLRGGDKSKSRNSLMKIMEKIDSDTVICPGHGPMVPANEILEHLDSLIETQFSALK